MKENSEVSKVTSAGPDTATTTTKTSASVGIDGETNATNATGKLKAENHNLQKDKELTSLVQSVGNISTEHV